MPSDLLIETVTMLKQRIEIRREYLTRNESPTRQLLIDPLLDALGWDFEDSSRVVLEFPIGRLRVDYVLIVDGRPKIAVEAKRFGTALAGETIRHCACWRTYEASIPLRGQGEHQIRCGN